MVPRPVSFPRPGCSTPGSPWIPAESLGLSVDGAIFGPPLATTNAYTGSSRVSR
jgi:hypothetical protein